MIFIYVIENKQTNTLYLQEIYIILNKSTLFIFAYTFLTLLYLIIIGSHFDQVYFQS